MGLIMLTSSPPTAPVQVTDASRAMGENSCGSSNDVASVNSGDATRNIDFTLDGKAGLFQVPRCPFGLV